MITLSAAVVNTTTPGRPEGQGDDRLAQRIIIVTDLTL